MYEQNIRICMYFNDLYYCCLVEYFVCFSMRKKEHDDNDEDGDDQIYF